MIILDSFSSDQVGFIFSDVIVDVISTTCGISTEVFNVDEGFQFNELIGLMNLTGKNHGIIFISADENSIRTLAAYMTGVSNNEITKDDIYDTLSEIVNMTAGNAKLRFNRSEDMFTLTSPFVISGKDMSAVMKKRINSVSRLISNSEISLLLTVVFY